MSIYYYDRVVLSKKITVHHIITSITVQTMDEQRAQAYVNLIEQLLVCTNDEEPNNIRLFWFLCGNEVYTDGFFVKIALKVLPDKHFTIP